MKTFKYTLLVSIVTGLSLLASCKKDAVIDETEEDIFVSNLVGTWVATAVQADGKDVSSSFPGLKITISDTRLITVTNAVPPIWKGSASFSLLPAGDSFQLKREDGVVMTLRQPSAKKMLLSFQYDPAKVSGRVSSVVGEFTFEFSEE